MDKEVTIIAFIGKKRSGKSTAANILVEKHRYLRVRFAQTLKDMLYEFGLSVEEVDGSLKELPCEKLGGKTPVQAMQTLGTEWGRVLIYPKIWVDAFDRELQEYIDCGLTRFVIDDLRFVNEKEYLDSLKKKYKVLYVRVHRDGVLNGLHVSETEMDKIEADYVINNNYNVETLGIRIDDILSGKYDGKEK